MIRKAFIIFLIAFSSCVYHDSNDTVIEVPFTCDPQTSWENDILPLMKRSCAVEGCHDGISRRDWSQYDEVKRYASSAKLRTQNRSMPFEGPPLTQDEINLIACWVDNGALNN
jgi:hypothetical protein